MFGTPWLGCVCNVRAGCPANIVTGGGAGSSLLKDPSQLHNLVAALVAAVGQVVPVSVKMRSGFDDTHLFKDNLLAVQVRCKGSFNYGFLF